MLYLATIHFKDTYLLKHKKDSQPMRPEQYNEQKLQKSSWQKCKLTTKRAVRHKNLIDKMKN